MKDLQSFLDQHQIRHKDLAFITGRTERAVYNWVQGIRPLPRPVQLLLMALEQGKIDEKWLASSLSHLTR